MTKISYKISRTWQVNQFEPLTVALSMEDELREGENPQEGYKRIRAQVDATLDKVRKEVEDDS